eukprot:g2564.t1
MFSTFLRRTIVRQQASIRSFAAAAGSKDVSNDISKIRNFGISAHIDSGKTTLTERILFYSGKTDAIHEVRGKDGVGAKMDSMELEREKGITIQSAATFCQWNDSHFNIVDTPGHVDFTVEVERALRVLDGAVLVLCGVAGVQSQSITVDRQMKRYDVPRLAFINKLDREGADPWKVIGDLRNKLALNACAIQLPIGEEKGLEGVVDLVNMTAVRNFGESGEKLEVSDIPANLVEEATQRRQDLVETLADVDEEVEELFLMEEEVDAETMKNAIRRATIGLKFVPVLMGSAFKNRGVQKVLDAVIDYLPSPPEVKNRALDLKKDEEELVLSTDPNAPLVALAFKLEEGQFGQLTYMRVYQGTLKRGQWFYNMNKETGGGKIKVPRLVRMHSDEMEDIDSAQAGEILATFGIDCASGDTFTDGKVEYVFYFFFSQEPFIMITTSWLCLSRVSMESMYVPDPVMSLAVTPNNKDSTKFGKAISRFCKEDPTFRRHVDKETKENIISGMGELHLQIYIERLAREYGVEVKVGKPRVNYREAITKRTDFNHLHKKQSGGSGQFGRIIGYMEPLEDELKQKGIMFEFENNILGNAIPPEYISAVEKGFKLAMEKGTQIGHPVEGVRVVLTDGDAHSVDSSEMAFRLCAEGCFRNFFPKANPTVLEPVMDVDVTVPEEYQGNTISGLNRRKGYIKDTVTDKGYTTISCEVPLNAMFGYSTDLRTATAGKGEFSMEYMDHKPCNRQQIDELCKQYQKERLSKED